MIAEAIPMTGDLMGLPTLKSPGEFPGQTLDSPLYLQVEVPRILSLGESLE